MPITNADAIEMAVPQYQFDKIIGVLSDTFVSPAPTAITLQTVTTDTSITGFNESCYFQGIYSIDSGVTWNDFGTDVANDLALNGLNISGQSAGNLFNVVATNNYGVSSGTTYTIMYKVALIAKNNQGFITPIQTNELLYYESGKNYPAIFSQGTVPYATSSGVQFSSVVTHNLGYVPKVSAWQDGFLASGTISSLSGIAPTVLIDTTTITFFTDAFLATTQTSNIDYRIYLSDGS